MANVLTGIKHKESPQNYRDPSRRCSPSLLVFLPKVERRTQEVLLRFDRLVHPPIYVCEFRLDHTAQEMVEQHRFGWK